MPYSAVTSLSAAERVARLQLIRTDNVGPITFRQLMARFGSAEAVVAALPELSRRGGRKKPLRAPSRASIDRELEALEACSGKVIHLGTPDYPERLAAIEDAPPVLMARGHPALLAKRSIAVVGPRNPSAAGLKLCHMIVSKLVSEDLVIVSGLARGIDAAAHKLALSTGTVACLAGGVDHIYPRENEALYHDIANAGCLLAEMPMGTQPQARHFPRRNRIISGLSLGVFVVEAAERSGTLITARYAADQGREVFAIPGNPLDTRARGTNGLIRDGAVMVESADDILHELASSPRPALDSHQDLPLFAASAGVPDVNAALTDKLRSLLAPSPVHIDDLIRSADADAGDVQAALLLLELAGEAVRYPGARIARVVTEAL